MKTMKSTLVMALAIGFATAFTSCGNSQDNSKTDSTVQTSVSKELASTILNSYLEIKDALVNTDSEAAGNAASDLVRAIGENQDELSQKIRLNAERISETEAVGQQREHFNTLSENIYKLVKSADTNDKKLYKQYCPMAFDNNGAYWLSAEKEINNPYFGDKMLHCGSVKEEL